MDFSGQYQLQENAYQTYDHSQIQAYDQSTNTFYSYPYNQQSNNPYYADQSYVSKEYQQQADAPIHPPGVEPPVSHPQAHPYSCYPQQRSGGFGGVAMPGGLSSPPMHSYMATGTRGGRHFRGGRGHMGPKPGRGRGRGRHQHVLPNVASAKAEAPKLPLRQGLAAPVWPTPRMAWCELCRVDCNTSEILEQHKNGKKHKKNLQVYEELQKLNKLLVVGQHEQPSSSGLKAESPCQPEKAEKPGQSSQENMSSRVINGENHVEAEVQKVEEEKTIEESTGKAKMDSAEGKGRGSKRKMRGARGVKWMRSSDGSRKPVEPPKTKEVFPLICELCNVRCESAIVFQSHLTGKKHLSNLKRLQGQQAVLEQSALQALYPALQALYPALQALCQQNAGGATLLGSQLHQQSFPGLQDILSQLAPSLFPQGQGQGQESAQPAILSMFRSLSAVETRDQQEYKPKSPASEDVSQKTSTEEIKNHDHSISLNPADEKADTDSKPGSQRSEVGAKFNHEIHDSVVTPIESAASPSELVASGIPTAGASGMLENKTVLANEVTSIGEEV